MDQPHLNEPFTPAYWAGHDIFDAMSFLRASTWPASSLRDVDTRRAASDFAVAMAQVATGKYLSGSDVEFAPGDTVHGYCFREGALAVIDQETLTRRTPPRGQELRETHWPHMPQVPINRPFVDYWRNNQDPEPPVGLGSEMQIAPGGNLFWIRSLSWAVATRRNRKWYLVPYRFGAPHVKNGQVEVPAEPSAPEIPLPLKVGRVVTRRRLTRPEGNYDTLSRVKSLEVVYMPDKQRSDNPAD